MSVLYVRRVGNILHADGDESIAELSTLPFGKPLRCEVRAQRNPRFHRLYWALCARIASGIGSNSETISTIFKYATNCCETVKSKRYGEIKIPKSISFSKMDDIGFRDYFNLCTRVAFEEWGLEPAAFADLLDPKTEMR